MEQLIQQATDLGQNAYNIYGNDTQWAYRNNPVLAAHEAAQVLLNNMPEQITNPEQRMTTHELLQAAFIIGHHTAKLENTNYPHHEPRCQDCNQHFQELVIYRNEEGSKIATRCHNCADTHDAIEWDNYRRAGHHDGSRNW